MQRASANSDPIQLLGHQHNYLPADVERLAHLERDLRSAQEDAAASKEQAERALSSMFVRLAKDRATHERERQQLQHRLLQASQELLHRRAHDKLCLDQAGKVRELWRDVMSVASLHPGAPGSGDEHRDQNNGTTSGASLKVTAALLQLQGPLLDLLDEVGGTKQHCCTYHADARPCFNHPREVVRDPSISSSIFVFGGSSSSNFLIGGKMFSSSISSVF